VFFLERKNQRTFVHLERAVASAPRQMNKSLFASFSSEKEESFLRPGLIAARALVAGDVWRLVDMCSTWFHTVNMGTMIQLRHVPQALHRRLKSRAALAGMSLSDYLLNEIRQDSGAADD
jgi:hypothetical protein